MEHARFNDSGMPPPTPVLGVQDSAILLMESLLILLRLARAEALQACATLPQLLSLTLYRLPVLLLTWVSFGVLIACSVYTVAGSPVLAAGSFFLLQLGLTLVLERRAGRLYKRMEFTETRKGLVSLQASLQERFGREAD